MKASEPRQHGRLHALLGIQQPVSARELLVSTITAGIAMAAVYVISHAVLGQTDAPLMVASMGSSAILVFAVPHGAFSQPWAVVAGHGVSALVGVLCAMFIPSLELAVAMAVGGSIALSLVFRCLHPSGGGTTLIPVLGGAGVQSLGLSFVLVPVLLNALILVLLGYLLNSLFPWRRYPAVLAPKPPSSPAVPSAAAQLSRTDLAYALRRLETPLEITESDLALLFESAMEHAQRDNVGREDVSVGGCYSNAGFGPNFQVRRVLAMARDESGLQVEYEILPGARRGTMDLDDFARWARMEVVWQNGDWRRR
ncbi:MAG: HPP family protein [Pseudomonadota bacterium]